MKKIPLLLLLFVMSVVFVFPPKAQPPVKADDDNISINLKGVDQTRKGYGGGRLRNLRFQI